MGQNDVCLDSTSIGERNLRFKVDFICDGQKKSESVNFWCLTNGQKRLEKIFEDID